LQDENTGAKKKSAVKIGLGLFTFYSLPSKANRSISKMYALHQAVGDPVGSDCGAQIYKNLVIFHEQSEQNIAEFITALIDDSEATEAGYFTYFKWHIRYQYWQNSGRCKARSIESVILPKATIDMIISDVDNFLAPVTQSFYDKHGIPYRRSYLFHGLPGTGKTSLIQALAGHYKRSVCYLQPTNPEMTDDSLKDAVSDLPDDAILVFEDIDSLFAKDRSSKVAKSALTFSGLLNALDGVGR
jgi:chaperone BCS1